MDHKYFLKALLLIAPLTACTPEEPASSAAQDNALVGRGAELFKDNCSECHTRGGRGDYLNKIPATLLTRRSENELMAWIQGSEKHREMPNFTNLNDEERQALAAYLLSQLPKK
jgi:mono/diheme cytochrome c family protein